MQRAVARTLPPAPGTILIIAAPPEMDWGNQGWLNALQVAAEHVKQANGFAGVIITRHDTDLVSMGRAELAAIGLMPIPGAHDMPTEGNA